MSDSDAGDGSDKGREAARDKLAGGPGNPRAHYEKRFAPLPEAQRAEQAQVAGGEDLVSLCYDPLPRVIHAVLSNPNCSNDHARIIAKEHRNPVGLGHVANKPRFLRDREVSRRLLQNPQANAKIVEKLIGNRPLLQLYRTCVDRNIPQVTRELSRRIFRRKWNQRDSEEKVALIVKTEGRCLPLLVGQALDGRAAAKLCNRSAMSTMMIRNLARWPATPPPVLRHLLRLPVVSRDKTLKQLLLRHPNMPSHLKRG